MTTLRMTILSNSVTAAYNDIRLVVSAHIQEIDEAMQLHGLPYVVQLVESVSTDPRDKHLYLAIRGPGLFAGNLPSWPDARQDHLGWAEAELDLPDGTPNVRIYFKTVKYRDDIELLVGYDLQNVILIRETLSHVLLDNTILAFILSFAIVLLILWLLNRHIQRFNAVCDQVMEGNLGYRINPSGSSDQFDKLSINLNRMLDWINLLIDTTKDTSNSIAHDMRTPLSRLRLELRALSIHPQLHESLRDDVVLMVNQLDALVSMFDNILSIARAESRAERELFSPFNIVELIEDIVDLYTPLFEERDMMISRDTPATDILFYGDKHLIGQCLVNLLENCIKFAVGADSIMVAIASTDHDSIREIRLTVADNGPGIAADLREKVKQRFFRGDKSRNTEGAGLGLSLVDAVVKLHHGTLLLEDNDPGLKATLVFRSTMNH